MKRAPRKPAEIAPVLLNGILVTLVRPNELPGFGLSYESVRKMLLVEGLHFVRTGRLKGVMYILENVTDFLINRNSDKPSPTIEKFRAATSSPRRGRPPKSAA